MTMLESPHASCPDCGTPLSAEAWASGLCLRCLVGLALRDASADVDGSKIEATAGTALAPGAVLGDRYRVRSRLGSGGMGEVWLAFDMKLRVDVALKSLRAEVVEDLGALETLLREVRLAREVISPNVCRVFDLQEVAGKEWISMEHVDGTSLAEILGNRGPLDLDEAGELAAQFLAGLSAIHDAGLLHRDVKPENLMVTRTGRVVVMDFGIAIAPKGRESAPGLEAGKGRQITGTPAYMSPEQARGEALDVRADVFSAGVVLAEMVAPAGLASAEDRQRVWEGIHAQEPEIADTPWAGVIARAVASDREQRLGSAAALARALEEVTLRVAGTEDLCPYPGLTVFTEENARFFFGREFEVEALWKKLRRPHLMGVIGAPGAGKSSLLRAGLLPALPDGWRAVVAAPGRRPFDALAQALLPEFAGDEQAAGGDPAMMTARIARWRCRHDQAILILDHFEELFTQNPPAVQEGFSKLIAGLPLAADVHVLISVRDDFLMACHRLDALTPVFSDLTPLSAPRGSALRRAIVQPALKCGYRFEDEHLVEQMLDEVEGERGALPLLAFAAARLWEKRDRERGLLTRQAYEEIGGVAGSIAHHAEVTLEQIGRGRLPVVRELFRNLVTAQETRATRDREELLSVFGHSEVAQGTAAGEVLDALVDARLLTSYEEPAAEKTSRTRIEMIHESLLTFWPHLVRWRTQDAEGAQLRDDLRYTAQRWQERGEPDDLLWTDSSRRELELWLECYPGSLSHSEQAFVDAVARRARRSKKRRRLALGAAFVVLAVLAALAILRP